MPLPYSATVLCALVGVANLCAQQNNVLIIIADDLGVENVGAYQEGANPPPTPNIDALAARGVLFRNAWVNPICSPTRASLQTGRYALRTGVGVGVVYQVAPSGTFYLPAAPQGVLQLSEVTLPELLDSQQSGYSHALIGKWHLGDQTNGGELGPNLAGWSHFAGSLGGIGYNQWPRTVNGTTRWSFQYPPSQRVNDALAWIQTAQEPWVVYLAFNTPHSPFHAPPGALHTQQQQLQGIGPGTTPIPFYKAMIEAMDTEIGRLFTSLGPTLQRTNVIFMGDNGTPSSVAEPPILPNRAKGSPYEGGLNVPLIVAGPDVGSAGREDAALVGPADLFATVADLCGVSAEVPVIKTDSVSFAPHIRSASAAPVRDMVYAESFRGGTPTSRAAAAIRNAQYKLIVNYFVSPPRQEFYDLISDPLEQQNLLLRSLRPGEDVNYRALVAEFNAIRRTAGSWTNFGTPACVGSNGNPTISITGTPMIGGSHTVGLANGPATQLALLHIGFSNTTWLQAGLPLSLVPLGGGPGCSILASGELTALVTTDQLGAASVPVRLPNLSVLVSGSLYHSWILVDPTAPSNPLGITTSDGAALTIGQ